MGQQCKRKHYMLAKMLLLPEEHKHKFTVIIAIIKKTVKVRESHPPYTAHKKLDFYTYTKFHWIVILPLEDMVLVSHLSRKIKENW